MQEDQPISSTLSLHDVHHFLISDCSEVYLRSALEKLSNYSFEKLIKPEVFCLNDFDEIFWLISQDFISRLYN